MGTAQLSKMIGRLRTVLEKSDAQETTDANLLRAYVRDRDEAAFAALVRRHGPMVQGVCYRVLHNHADAQDAFQATLLILVRKAASLRSPALLANWLYGVAFRTAQEARRSAAIRRTKEATMTPKVEPSEERTDGLRAALDVELERLPDKYRVVLVLCDLEGKTRKEAARQLSWPEGTVAGRLARGRAQLARRLARHGVNLSALALAEQLGESAGASSVTTALLARTVEAATVYGTKQAVGGVIPASAVRLAEGVLKSMLLTKLKILSCLVIVGAATFTGLGLSSASPFFPSADEPSKQERSAEKSNAQSKDAKKAEDAATEVASTSAGSLQKTFTENEAFGDEILAGKTLKVTGLVAAIKRSARDPIGYVLILSSDLSIPFTRSGALHVTFEFGKEAGPLLANLNEAQELTIEGQCKGLIKSDALLFATASSREAGRALRNAKVATITFVNCKIEQRERPNVASLKGLPATARILDQLDRNLAINDALVDEKLAGKRHQAKGKISRVMRNDRFAVGEGGSYLVVVDPWDVRRDVITDDVLPLFYFRFEQGSRKELVSLKAGQMVTIEGECADRQTLGIFRAIVFQSCKVLAVE